MVANDNDGAGTSRAGGYKVVVNHEEQYSIWPADQASPAGWRDIGVVASREECLRYIDEVWTDMRPLSMRRTMGRGSSDQEPPPTGPTVRS